jgi:hypothetical protein
MSATSCIEYSMNHIILDQNFKSIFEKLDKWQSIQVHSPGRNKNNKFWESYHNFLFGTFKLGQTCGIAEKTY